jgi:hypothetical protein
LSSKFADSEFCNSRCIFICYGCHVKLLQT